MVTVSSGAIDTQQLMSQGSSAARMPARLSGITSPSAKPPPAALAPTRNERRSTSPPERMNNPLLAP
jgi:hypothetical protein